MKKQLKKGLRCPICKGKCYPNGNGNYICLCGKTFISNSENKKSFKDPTYNEWKKDIEKQYNVNLQTSNCKSIDDFVANVRKMTNKPKKKTINFN